MIKQNELRIGNLILFKEYGKGKGKIGQIKPGDFGRVKYDDPEESEYHPIPLTPEWLKRFGFIDGVLYIKPLMTSFRGANKDTEVRYCDAFGNSISRYYQYVHQLQNLYFWQTGEELTIKEPA